MSLVCSSGQECLVADASLIPTATGHGFSMSSRREGVLSIDCQSVPEKHASQPKNDFAMFGRECADRIYGNETWSVSTRTMKCMHHENQMVGSPALMTW